MNKSKRTQMEEADINTLPELHPWFIAVLLRVPTFAFFLPFPMRYLMSFYPT